MLIKMREMRQYTINNDSEPFRWDVMVQGGQRFNGDDRPIEWATQYCCGSNTIVDPGTPDEPSEELIAARKRAARHFRDVLSLKGQDDGQLRELQLTRAVAWCRMIEVEI